MSDLQLRSAPHRRMVFVGAATVPRTGGERYSAAIIDAARRRGWRVDVLTPDDLPRPARTSFLAANRWLMRLHGRAARETVVVEDFYWHPRTFIFNWWMRARGARLVCIVHHLYHDLRPVRWQRWADRLIGALSMAPAHAVIVNSASTEDAVAALGVPRRRLVRVPPGVDRIPGEPAPPDARGRHPARLLVVGNVDRRKGLEYLVRALAEVSSARAEIVGRPDYDPAYRSELDRLIDSLGVGDRVTFRGRLDEPELAAAYDSAAAFVAPSLWEGFGVAVLEAMLHGLPIVATDVGAIPELVRDGDTGLLVRPRDATALAEAIERVLTDGPLAQRLGARARVRALEVARPWDAVGDQVTAVVEAVASR